MKKIILISLLTIGSLPLLAQTSVGLKVGGALSGQAFEGVGLSTGNDVKPTYLGGVFVTVPLTKTFSLQPEVLYINKGLQFVGNSSNPTRYNLHYLSVPIMLRYHILNRLTVELGPEVSYLLDATTNLNFNNAFSSLPTSSIRAPTELL